MPSYAPTSIKGAAFEEVTLALIAKGCCGACSSSVSLLLQLPVCGLEDLGVVASCHRPISPQSLRGRVVLPHGDHPVCSSVCLTGRLDGLHRPSGGVSPGSCSSGISSLPTLCGSWPRLPVHSAVLRSVHGPTGLHSGYGSCVSYTSFLGYPYASLPERLARPGLLPGGSPPGSQGCLVPLSRVGDRSQPGEVQLLSVSGGPVSQGDHRRKDFYGFSIARLRLQAAVNRWRISVLRRASCQLVAVAAGDVVLSVSSGSRGLPADEIAPDLILPLLGSVGSFGSCAMVSRLSSGPSVVASRGSPLSRGVSPSGFPGSGLLVRCFRRQLGGSLWETGLLPAFGTSRRLFFQSMPGSCWQCVAVSSTSSPFCQGPRWQCFATTSPRLPICARRGAPSLLLSPPLRRISSVGRNLQIRLAPQFIPGIHNVLADSLSRPHQLPSSEWSLNMDVFQSLTHQWPVMIDLFATSDNHCCSIYFLPYRDPLSAGTDALLQSWDGLLAYAFPTWSILPRVLAKLWVSHQTLLALIAPYWPQRPWFVDLLQLSVAPPVILSARPDLLFQPQSRRRYPGLHRLALHAWRLSSDSPERLVSPRR